MTREPGIERINPTAYNAQMDAALAGREPVTVLVDTADRLRNVIETHDAALLRRRPYPDRWTWTPLEVIGHLVDCEWTIGWRTRTALCDDGPTLTGMDQEKWVAKQKHNDRKPGELVADFAALRAINLHLWAQLDVDDWKRTAHHTERGDMTLHDLIRWLAGHDAYHLAQINRYIGVITKKS